MLFLVGEGKGERPFFGSHPMGVQDIRNQTRHGYMDINRAIQGACSASVGRFLGCPNMGDPGGALRIWWGVSRVDPWARIVDGSRAIGWDHCEALGEMPRTGLAKQGPRVISLLRVMLGPNLAQCTAGLCSSACCLGCARGCVPRGRLAMGVLLAHGLCTASIGTLHPPAWRTGDDREGS